MQDVIPCRLCGGKSTKKFHRRSLQEIDIAYFECTHCGSLQTQDPTWLHEVHAHGPHGRKGGDTGAAQRILTNHALVLITAKVF
jgi:hypothetical protein